MKDRGLRRGGECRAGNRAVRHLEPVDVAWLEPSPQRNRR
ncbi:unnamed protein product [Phaeothamnion confervicola]